MTLLESGAFRYPRRLEIFRLEPLGDDPYMTTDEARRRYDDGRGLSVLADGDPPAWYLGISAKAYRFTVTFYSARKTPIRRVIWEQVDRTLFCRRSIDYFYPAGEQQMPLTDVVSVTQRFSTDGILDVTLSSSLDDDRLRRVTGAPLDGLHTPVPAFGEWQPVLAASTPTDLVRFGLDAIDASIAFADQIVACGESQDLWRAGADSGWRMPAGEADIARTVDAIASDGRDSPELPVIVRGDVKIIPLALQADPHLSGRDPREERNRMMVLADGIRDSFEHCAGQAITFNLDAGADGPRASYAAALRAAGATRADWWLFEPPRGVVLVWSGTESSGDLSLAVHVVPASWVAGRHEMASAVGTDLGWTWEDLAELPGVKHGRL